MPTYDYQCDNCGHRFEKFQSITAAPIKKCPACGKNKVKRLLGTGAGIIFKGSGFYITDYRDKGYAEKAKAETGGGGSSTDGGAGSSDAKPSSSSGEAKPATTKAESKPASTPAKSDAKSPSPSPGKKPK